MTLLELLRTGTEDQIIEHFYKELGGDCNSCPFRSSHSDITKQIAEAKEIGVDISKYLSNARCTLCIKNSLSMEVKV